MAQNKAGHVVPLTAQTQQILIQALREIEFAAVRVIARLPVGNLNELRGRPQAFPQLATSDRQSAVRLNSRECRRQEDVSLSAGGPVSLPGAGSHPPVARRW